MEKKAKYLVNEFLFLNRELNSISRVDNETQYNFYKSICNSIIEVTKRLSEYDDLISRGLTGRLEQISTEDFIGSILLENPEYIIVNGIQKIETDFVRNEDTVGVLEYQLRELIPKEIISRTYHGNFNKYFENVVKTLSKKGEGFFSYIGSGADITFKESSGGFVNIGEGGIGRTPCLLRRIFEVQREGKLVVGEDNPIVILNKGGILELNGYLCNVYCPEGGGIVREGYTEKEERILGQGCHNKF